MAAQKSPKIEAQVVEAIRRLQAIQGSTSQEISNYIAQEYNIPGSEIRRHVQLALRRGVTYGILQRLKGGCYTYNQDYMYSQYMNSGDATAVDIRCRRKRRSSRRRSSRRRGRRRYYKSRGSRRRSRRRRSRGRRRKSSRRRRRREEFPKEIDALKMTTVTKQSSKSSNLLPKDGPRSNHSTISANSEEKQDFLEAIGIYILRKNKEDEIERNSKKTDHQSWIYIRFDKCFILSLFYLSSFLICCIYICAFIVLE